MSQDQIVEQLFAGKSEMARRMRSLDWSQTPLGAVEGWTQSLRSALSICLNSRFPIAIYWGQDAILLYNDAWRPIVGDKHPWALGRSGHEVWSEIWDSIGPGLAGVLATGEGTFHQDELLAMHRFGYTEECFFEYTFNPIQGEGGVVEGVFNIVTETTYRVLSERRNRLLREVASRTATARTAEAACALMIEAFRSNAADLPFALLYLVSQDGKQAHLCSSTEPLSDRFISPAVVDLAAPEDRDRWLLSLVVQTAQPQTIPDLADRFGVLPGGVWAEPPQEAMVLPISAPGQGKVTGVLVAVASPRRRLDDPYRAFLSQVAGQVALAIANARSYEEERQRAEALAELDRAKTAFFSNVSHEFRTPLTLLLSPLEELSNTLDARLQPDEREQLRLMQRNGLRLEKLVNTLLDFSRIEAGRVQASYEPTDLATYTAELASVFRSLIERAGMTLQINCPKLSEPVYVDREMWEKIVLNLISNAFKFTFSGSITVRLQPHGDAVELSVADTGVGIPEAELPRLFERFYRVSGMRSRTYEGSGIGLALVQELVKLHGGTIRVASQVNRGTTFTVSVPFGSAHLPADRVEAARTLASTASGAASYLVEASRWLSGEGERGWIGGWEGGRVGAQLPLPPSPSATHSPSPKILLVDDNADMREYLKRLLSQQYEVETVGDGSAALTRIDQQMPDLVLSDVMMPSLDGFGLLRELRAHPRTQEVPLILLSARAGEESRIEGLEAGADDYLTKPFSARELMARVEATLKLSRIRKEAAQAIRENEERLRFALSAARMVAWEWDLTTGISQRSGNAAEILGLGTSAVSDFYAMIHPDDRPIVTATVDRVVRGEAQYDLEFRLLTADGQIIWVADKASLRYDDQGKPTHLVGVCVDITHRKQAEAKVQQLNQQLTHRVSELQTLFDVLPVGVAIAEDPECRMIRLNPYLSKLTRVPVDANASQSAPPEERPSYRLYRDGKEIPAEDLPMQYAALHDTDVRNEVVDLLHPDGALVKLLCYASPLHNAQGEVRGAIGGFVDITDRVRMEAVLQESEERYRTLFESIDQGFCIIEMIFDAASQPIDYRFLITNPAFDQQTGTKNAQGRRIREIAPQNESYWFEIYGSVALTGKAIRFESWAEEFHRWYEVHAFRIGEPNLRRVGILFNDISNRKRTEAEREQLLAREQTAREAAESANRIKDEFLAVLSHELRSPLNPILGWAKLLQQGKLDVERTKTALMTIERNAQLQVQLINDLLDISRILRGKLSLDILPVNLSAVISAALETVHLAAEAKSLNLQTAISSGVGAVMGDAGRLQQVVWNLLSNAVKFTPPSGTVTIALTQTGTCAQIQVIDTGKGIKPDFLPYVFDHFRQEDGATTRQFGGLGLGLAIARQIVEMHGGQIGASSLGEGLGATFTVQLPLAALSHQPPPSEGSSTTAQNLSGIRILVVDDEPDSREFLAFVLEQAGAIVAIAASGIEALQAIEQAVPDLIVSDIGMPEMDGYMLLQQIRAIELAKHIPAIALTAYAGEYDRQQAIAAGFQQHMPKPVEPEELVNTICSTVRRAT